jgi:prepilin-type processing-associated H-X9-DG protein
MVADPTQTVMLCDSAIYSYYSGSLIGNNLLKAPGEVDYWGPQVHFRHNGVANVVYVDGHAKAAANKHNVQATATDVGDLSADASAYDLQELSSQGKRSHVGATPLPGWLLPFGPPLALPPLAFGRYCAIMASEPVLTTIPNGSSGISPACLRTYYTAAIGGWTAFAEAFRTGCQPRPAP